MQNLNVALIQSKLHWEDKQANFKLFEKHIEKLPSNIDLIVLPEMFSTGFSMKPKMFAEKMTGNGVQWMKNIAQKENSCIVGSLIIEENNKYYNRLIAMKADGTCQYYDKRHLFRLSGEEKVYSYGTNKTIIALKGWSIALFICYDLRFPVWTRTGENVDCQIFVANWPEKRKDAWSSLLKARAIENQAYVIGVNRVGTDGNGFEHSGNSGIYGPLGEILFHEENNERLIIASLSKKTIDTARSSFPFYLDSDPFKLL